MPRTSRAQNPAVVIIQQFARRLLAMYRAATMRNHLIRLDRPPRALRDRRQRYERHAERDEFHAPPGTIQIPFFNRFPGRGDLYWRNDNMVTNGHGPSREDEWNLVHFRPSGPGTGLPRTGYLRASVDPEAGYLEEQVRFGRPMCNDRLVTAVPRDRYTHGAPLRFN